MIKETIYFLTLIYFCLTSILFIDFFVSSDNENWLLAFNLFNYFTFNGWLYLLSIVLIIYFVKNKTNQSGRINFVPFKNWWINTYYLSCWVTKKIKSATKVLHLRVLKSKKLERETRFELATSTLARLRSTSWAIPAFELVNIPLDIRSFKKNIQGAYIFKFFA